MQPLPVKCKSCGAAILWLVHGSTHKIAPIDAAPDPAGNILISGSYYAVITNKQNVLAPTELHTNHFQTCPDKADWTTKAKAPHALPG